MLKMNQNITDALSKCISFAEQQKMPDSQFWVILEKPKAECILTMEPALSAGWY